MGIDSDAARLVDGLTDDYEIWHGELPKALHKDKSVLYVPGLRKSKVGRSHIPPRKYKSEAASTEGREVMVLMSGAWKT